ncbi:MAG: TIGR00730 family Rossman fold protein [Clostridia bacterium]|nr:TIGR00730 family Rossman fold protein [Clostridia bacterium]
MKICVYGASSNQIDKNLIKTGEALGEEMAKRGIPLIFGAGANGMMGAVARGITKGGGHMTGIAPSFFEVDGIIYDKCDELIRPETMWDRKTLLRDFADAYIVTPGGIGTMDEFFEVLTLKQLGRTDKAMVILNIDGFYDKLIALLDGFIKDKAVKETVYNLFYVTTSITDALDYIENYTSEKGDATKYKFI